MRALTLVAALCALVAAGCGSEAGENAAAPATETTTSAEASGRPPAPAIGGVSLEGEPISLAEFQGQAVFVNVWSSW